MKKKLLALGMTFALVSGAAGGITAFAEVSLEECDRCFQTTVNGFLAEDEVGGNQISAVKTPVYDIGLEQLGYLYEFEIASGEGYAIIICDGGNYVAQEFVPESQSPYSSVTESELSVYVNSMTYLKYAEGAYRDIQTSEEIPAEVLEEMQANAIVYRQSDINSTHDSVTINYSSRSSDYYSLSRRIPRYTNPGDLDNACAAVAGSNLIGFYDRYYEDLIPNHAAGYEAYGMYLYNLADSYVDNATRELYSDMNGSSAGITEANFKSGMQRYCAKRNLSCDFTQLMSSGKLSFSSVKQSINENKPIALLVSTYNVADILPYDDYDVIKYDYYYGNHVMAGFGYNKLSYTMSDGSSASYEFVHVASGYTLPVNGYFNINYCTNINSAYKVYIH